eukprot:3276913-Amphidinium_carterae.2
MAPKSTEKKSTRMSKAWEAETKDVPMSRGKCGDMTDLATKVRKAISDNLKSLTEAEIYGTVVNGKTCYQQVLADKERWIKGELATMGSKYWSDLRGLYQGPDNMRKLIEIAEGTPIDKDVLTAIDASLRHPPNRSLLLGLCRRKSEFKKGNALALMKMLTNVCASASSKQLQMGMELVECLHRMGAFAQLPDVTSVLRPKLDSILLQVRWV